MLEATILSAFNKLFYDYKHRFISFAQTYVHDSTTAEDFVIDSLLYYWENRHSVETDSNIPGYILTVIKHKCLNHLHHEQLAREVAENLRSQSLWELKTCLGKHEFGEPHELFVTEIHEVVNYTLMKLPERTRRVFIMSRMQNIPHREIAAEIAISTKGVEFHITKALKALRVNLKDYFPSFFYFFIEIAGSYIIKENGINLFFL